MRNILSKKILKKYNLNLMYKVYFFFTRASHLRFIISSGQIQSLSCYTDNEGHQQAFANVAFTPHTENILINFSSI